MFVSRCCAIGLCLLLNLNVLCQVQGQGQGQGHRPHQTQSDAGFGYPENEEEDPGKKNAQNKTPVYVANRCKEGEILYPGDQQDDWVCDCKPAYLYYPLLQKCYHAYTQGPCPPGQYLVLPSNSVVPICRQNPCKIDKMVPFQNGCYELDKPGPCKLPELPNLVGVNETTLEIICTKDKVLESRVGAEENYFYPDNICFIGGKRWTNNTCVEQDHSNKDYNNNFNNNYNSNYNSNFNNNNYNESYSELGIDDKIHSIFEGPSST